MTATVPHAPHTGWGRSLGLGVVLAAAVGVIVLAFTWPSVTLAPKDLPIAITGPAAMLEPVETALAAQGGDAFALIEVEDRDAAAQLIRQREAYGAIVLGESPEVLTSSAASTATSQLMTQLHAQLTAMVQQQVAAQFQAQAAQLPPGATPPTIDVPLTDVVPLSANDPRGAGLTAASFPLVLGGMLGGIAIALVVSGAWRRIVALLGYSIAGGLVITGIMQGWFGVLEGDYLLNTAAFSLTLLAMGATIVGFAALFGRPGIAVGPVLFMLIANPISGAAFPKEFLPVPWGEIGQYLPPGAGASLVRTLSYFPEANAWFPVVVLACWAVGGLALTVIGHFRDEGRIAVAAGQAAPSA